MLFGRPRSPRIITGLDIGTTKVCAIIGQTDAEGHLTILGMGSCPSSGLRCGEIVDITPTVNAITQAVSHAVEIAGVSVGDIYVGIAGEHIKSQNTTAMVEIRHPTRGIDRKDRSRVVEKARLNIPVPDDKAMLHAIVQEFRVNGGNATANPIGLSGANLEVSAHLVLSDINPVHNIVRCVRRASLRSPHVVLQSMASSMSVITPTERELGVVLVDIGGGTTDVAVSINGAIRSTAEISLGGDHIMRDVAQVLNCSLRDAENVKKRHGSALPQMVERGRTFELPAAGDVKQLVTHEEYLLAEVIEARLEDIFTIVREYLDRSGYRERAHAGVVLTGGTSLLNGIRDVAERILEMKCRCGCPEGLRGLATVVRSPIYSTGIGLILYGVESDNGAYLESGSYTASSGMTGGVKRLLDYFVEAFIS
jgi:cell division protein FtsA